MDSSRGGGSREASSAICAHLIQLGVVRDAVGVDPVVPRRPRRRIDVQPARCVCDHAVVGLRVVVVLNEVIPEAVWACHVVNAHAADPGIPHPSSDEGEGISARGKDRQARGGTKSRGRGGQRTTSPSATRSRRRPCRPEQPARARRRNRRQARELAGPEAGLVSAPGRKRSRTSRSTSSGGGRGRGSGRGSRGRRRRAAARRGRRRRSRRTSTRWSDQSSSSSSFSGSRPAATASSKVWRSQALIRRWPLGSTSKSWCAMCLQRRQPRPEHGGSEGLPLHRPTPTP